MKSIIGDIRDFEKLEKIFRQTNPEIVFHLAAQPIVRESYENPMYTYETNVMGTVNILECVRNQLSVKSVLNVTTDKVYKNNEWEWGYRENEELDGFDPYPFILLNLVLSCIAALQAPIIMMSQNREAKKDSMRSKNDYRIDLKSELILEVLHEQMLELKKTEQKILQILEENDIKLQEFDKK